MIFPADPIEFLDAVADEHKRRLRKRKKQGETLRYMGEVADQLGRGEEFMQISVYNPKPRFPDPNSPETDLALLQLYQHWRALHSLRPIEPWDGTRLRPWLPAESNPVVPAVLRGDLSHFLDATLHTPVQMISWRRLDALGHAIESYFLAIRRHTVWSRPSTSHAGCAAGEVGAHGMEGHGMEGHGMEGHGMYESHVSQSGPLRLYLLNELNNIETAVYSIRFWGFLKWADDLRCKLFGLPVESYPHDRMSDISFMDEFVLNHFPWHDDVFGHGVCPRWDDQFGRRALHRYPVGTQGYGLEFLQFHRELIEAYDSWRASVGMPPVKPWRPGKHHTAYVMKYAFDSWWGRDGTNGRPLNPEVVVPELEDPDLSTFDTAAELGHYLDACGVVYHGIGHIQNCDIRDPYCNNYSVRFFGWHKWIDTFYARLQELGKSLYDESRVLDDALDCEKFSSPVPPEPVLAGIWACRSFMNTEAQQQEAPWPSGAMHLSLSVDNRLIGELRSTTTGHRYELRGFVDESNVYYETSPQWWDERLLIALKAAGATPDTAGQVFEYRGAYQPRWPFGKEQSPAFTGTVICSHFPDAPEKEGLVGSFLMTREGPLPSADQPAAATQPETQTRVFVESGIFAVPKEVAEVTVRMWGGGGGGGSDGPGVGGDDGKPGETSRFGYFCAATGGSGGQHGVYQIGEGGVGGVGSGGAVNQPGDYGEKGGQQEGLTGMGGAAGGRGGRGGTRAGRLSNGRPGNEPGGGGSGAQEAMSPGGGGGGGGYVEGRFSVIPGSRIEIIVGQGGQGGDGGYRTGGDGASGRVDVSWAASPAQPSGPAARAQRRQQSGKDVADVRD